MTAVVWFALAAGCSTTFLLLLVDRAREVRRARRERVARVRAELTAQTLEHHHWLMWSYEQAAWEAADRPMPDVADQKVSHP
ncbi:MAG TPA: hypothetical protein VF642_12480 [Propionibacteriaceae bacterium]